MHDIKTKLSGAFALMLLFSRGVKSFSGEKHAAIRSIVIPFALFPFTLWFNFIYPPKGMETGYPFEAILAVVTGHFIISYIFTAVAVGVVAQWLKRTEKFWLFFEASNWASLAFTIVTVPFMLMAVYEVFPREEMDRILALTAMYGYVVTGCIAWRALEVNWQLAGAIAILTLFMNQETSHVLYMMMGVPIPW